MINSANSMLKDKHFLKTSTLLALPMIFQNLLTSGMNMADVVMIGHIKETAGTLINTDTQISAVSIANQISFLLYIFFIGISGGISIFISRYLGSGETASAKKTLTLGTFATFFFAVLITLLSLLCPRFLLGFFSRDPAVLSLGVSYLRIVSLSYIFTSIAFVLSTAIRCTGNSRPPLFASIVGIGLNVSLNYVLIFGKLGFPVLGVRGAAIATLVARFIEFLLVVYFSFRRDSIWRGKPEEYLSLSGQFSKNIYKGCLPVLVNDIQWGFANLMYCVAFGLIGTQALTVTQVLKNVNDILLVVCIGYSNTALIMISRKIGEGDLSSARTYGVYFDILAFVSGALISVILFSFSGLVATFFGLSGDTLEAAKTILRFLSFMFPIRSLAIMLVIGVLRGNGDTSFAMWAELCSMWLVGVPLAFLGVFLGLPVQFVVLLTFAEEVVKMIVSLIRQKSARSIKVHI